MNTRLIVLLLSATAASGVRGLAVPVAATQSPASAITTLRMNGTIDKFDASTRILSLSTSNGTVQFAIASTARVRQGWHSIDLRELQKLAGYRATVRYSESDGHKTVESVHVFGK